MSFQPEHTRSGDVSGVMIIDKPRGPTSMDVVEFIRRRAGRAKTGHAGTLDPLASGVLIVALGRATKLIDQFMATIKRYETVIDLSAFTSTDDLQGERTEVDVAVPPDEAQVRSALARFTGRFMQKPPAYSAIKIGGRRAYQSARQGQAVDIPPREVMVHSMDLVRFAWPEVELRVHCDKGFYVRSLARDLGHALGAGGHCQSIRRTAVGPFTIDMAVPLADLPEQIGPNDVMPIDRAVAMLRE